MPSDKRTRKRLNKLAGAPVRIIVCAYPSPTIEPVMDLLKSAVMYGDHVVLHSPVASMLDSISQIAQAGSDALLELVLSVGPEVDPSLSAQIDQMDSQFGTGMGKRILGELANPRSLTRALINKELSAAGLDLEELDQKLAGATAEFGDVAEQQLTAAGLDELEKALGTGVLSIEPVELDDDLIGYQRQLNEILHGPGSYPVFDQRLADLIATMIAAGVIEPSPRALRRGTQVATADRLLANLPTFPAAKMDEVVDIREELRKPLVGFRAEMIKVTAELQLSQLDKDFGEAAEELWHERVRPKLLELDEIVAQSGLIRTYGAEVGAHLAVPAGTAFVVGLQTGTWPLTALGVLAGLGVPAAKRAAVERKEVGQRRQQNPYYFLHAVDANLS